MWNVRIRFFFGRQFYQGKVRHGTDGRLYMHISFCWFSNASQKAAHILSGPNTTKRYTLWLSKTNNILFLQWLRKLILMVQGERSHSLLGSLVFDCLIAAIPWYPYMYSALRFPLWLPTALKSEIRLALINSKVNACPIASRLAWHASGMMPFSRTTTVCSG